MKKCCFFGHTHFAYGNYRNTIKSIVISCLLNRNIEGGDDMGKIAMLDVSESGRKIGEKLFAALDPKQKKELIQYFFERDSQSDIDNPTVITPNHDPRENQEHSLTKIYEGDLYFCLEHRVVCVRGQEVGLTAKEFDILALLIMNSKRVFTYEMIIDIVWHEDCDYYSRKAINNHVSNLRKKLKVAPDVPDYIKSVHSVGYKFDI